MNTKVFITALVLVLFTALKTVGQISAPGGIFHHIDILRDTSEVAFHPTIPDNITSEPFLLLNPKSTISNNSSYARGLNDGPIWKGKGLTSELHLGVTGTLGNLSYTLYPAFFHSQNLEFQIPSEIISNGHKYNYPFKSGLLGDIDLVQRFGPSPFFVFHLGQSELKFKIGKFISSISTQNYSVGPSVINPIILSRQGGGFPHLRIGSDPITLKIKNTELGKFTTNFLVGYLKESNYYDNDYDNNFRYINGLFLSFKPSFLENLSLGFNKVLYKELTKLSPRDLISVIKVLDTAGQNDQFDQLASATIQWKFLDFGFRCYAEFALNDFGGASQWIEPEHSRAYTIGFEKFTLINKTDNFYTLYEHTNLSRNHTYMWRSAPSYYIHSENRQGYTHLGQLLGAGIGPGSNSDMLIMKYTRKNKTVGVSGQRIEYNKDYFVVNIADRSLHDVEYSGGLFFQQEFDKFKASVETIFSKNNNRYYVNDENNVYMSLALLYKLH
ncbi:MAG: hypothetical protein JXR10_15245 [Cyclobacteriaceae bacterium]